MEALRKTHGYDTVDMALRFTIVRCRSRPETAALGAELTAKRKALRERYDAWLDAQDERLASSAEVVYRDEVVGARVMSLSLQAQAAFDGSADAVSYRLLFPNPPSAKMRGVATREQEAFVDGVILTLGSEATLEPLRVHMKPLQAVQGELKAAVQRRNELRVGEARTRTLLDVALDDARDAYNLAWHRLNLLYPGDKSLVESFFRAVTARAAPDDEAPAPAPTATPT